MTREEAIKMLRGMKAENLNLANLYTKDKYNALDMAIKALEQEPKAKKVIKMRDATPEERESIDKYIKSISTTGVDFCDLEPCEDCVNRKELLKIYEDRFIELQKIKHLKDNKGAEDRQLGVNYCINILKELPSVTPTQRWIPVSERLPENDEVVLGTNSSNDLFETYTWDDCGEIKWYANGCFDVPIIAWMPLPEPYKEEDKTEQGLAYADQDTMMSAT